MTIQQLTDNKVMVSLCDEDMKGFDLSFDTMGICDRHSHKILFRLMNIACTKSGIDTKGKSVMLEAVPYIGGCILLISVSQKPHKRKKYRIQRIMEYPCYRFDSAEVMLSAIEKLYNCESLFYNNSVYVQNDVYYLVFDYPVVSDKALQILSEYANKCKGTKAFIARLHESAKKLSSGNAIVHIGAAL